MVQIVEYGVLAPGETLAELSVDGLSPTNVTTSATAANTDLDGATRAVTIFAEDKAVRYDIGIGVTAGATSLKLAAGQDRTHAVPKIKGGTWRVSVIDQA